MAATMKQEALSLFATKMTIGEKRYYLLWPSSSAEAATEFASHYAGIGLAEEIDPEDPYQISLQVCYGRETDHAWETANRDAKRWQEQGWLDLAPIVREVLDRLAMPQTDLRSRSVLLSSALLNHLGQQPGEQFTTMILAGLEFAGTTLNRLLTHPMATEQQNDIDSLVQAIADLVEAAAPILQRFDG